MTPIHELCAVSTCSTLQMAQNSVHYRSSLPAYRKEICGLRLFMTWKRHILQHTSPCFCLRNPRLTNCGGDFRLHESIPVLSDGCILRPASTSLTRLPNATGYLSRKEIRLNVEERRVDQESKFALILASVHEVVYGREKMANRSLGYELRLIYFHIKT